MSRTVLDPRVLADPSWWHWAATVPLLAAHLSGYVGAIQATLALCAAMAAYFLARVRRWRPLPVQVRLAYFGWLSVGLLPGMGWMHVVALAGTTAMVVVGYCPLARMVGLLWFNRSEPLSAGLVWRQVVAAPAGGLFTPRPSAGADRPAAACSLGSRRAG
ncbi:MAG TPA: hypothetical protein VKD90_27930 [Gemmataceae bacterium]|nr:hypothetical protein [Gemmataceae bacterium]